MDATDFVTHYYLNGQPVEPPAMTDDEDTDIANYEDFVLQDGIVVERRCTVDGRLVYPAAPGGGQGMACTGGHRWLHVAPDPNVPGSIWGWRQVN